MDGFTKSLDELLHFADYLKQHEKALEQQHQLDIEKLKGEYDLEIKLWQGRNKILEEHNRTLTKKVERMAQEQTDFGQNYSTLEEKYSRLNDELDRTKKEHDKKKNRIAELDKIVEILKKDRANLDDEMTKLRMDRQLLEEKLKEATNTASATPPITGDILETVAKAVAENHELLASIERRDIEIQRLTEQLKTSIEDAQIIEQRCLHLIEKLKKDFSMMYENQSKFFLGKIDLLKVEQRNNIAKIYEP